MNENENKICQHIWDADKATFRGKITAANAYMNKGESTQINNLTLNSKGLGKEGQTKTKASRMKEIIEQT